jgi:6,7-dimethyl-8-ribityllumazine synthase
MPDKRQRFLIVEARFYQDLADALAEGAIAALDQAGADHDRLEVPGALEIPGAIAMASQRRDGPVYDGYIALGCVIRGETYHFEIVSNETNRGLMNVALKHSFPLGNGIITAYNYEQALKRSINKGEEAASACYELIKIKNFNDSVDTN